MSRAALAFTIASFLPVPLIVAGAVIGGVWGWLALFYMTAFAFGMDELIAAADTEGREFPAHNVLSVALAIAHFGVLALVVWALATGVPGGAGSGALFLATGLFLGQVSNSNAHELIHRGRRPLFVLGRWVYISLLFGHHASAHPLVHHRYVASTRDPNSARLGESYYRFAWRAWTGSFRAGYRAECDRLQARGRGSWAHPYVLYVLGAAGFAALAALAFGMIGSGRLCGSGRVCAVAVAVVGLCPALWAAASRPSRWPVGACRPNAFVERTALVHQSHDAERAAAFRSPCASVPALLRIDAARPG